MLQFLTVTGTVVVLKLLSSADDIVWYARLVAGARRMRLWTMHAVYLTALLVACAIAWVLAGVGNLATAALTGREGWFSLLGSVALLVFAVTALRKEDDDEAAGRVPPTRLRDVFAVSLLGSLDEIAVFTVALSTGEIPPLPLLVGTLLAGIVTLALVMGVRGLDTVTRRLDRIPVWMLVAALGCVGIVLSVFELGR